MKKYSTIVQALLNLGRALRNLNLQRIEFKHHKFNTLNCIVEIDGIEPIIYFKRRDTSPIVYLNLN